MIFAFYIFSMLFTVVTAEELEQNSNESHFDIPMDLLCPLCQSVIDGYKKQVQANPNFQKELLANCEKLSKDNRDQLLICHEKITDINVKKLQEMSTKDICLEEKFCSSDDEITSLVFENPVPENMTIEDIPTIPGAGPAPAQAESKPLQSTSSASLTGSVHILVTVGVWSLLSVLVS